MSSFEWKPLRQLDTETFVTSRNQLHQAVQNVSAVGRKFLPADAGDENAVLHWVPGLARMAGAWVEGDISFRSSIDPATFTIYLVDRKVLVISSFDLHGKSYRQLMVWLEEQIGKIGLDAANLTMNLPYELPDSVTQQGDPFELPHPNSCEELAKYYHNTYKKKKKIKEHRSLKNTINIWPHHFDMAMDVVLKETGDPETNTKITFGMSPGDSHFDRPYFYVNTWPFVDTSNLGKLSNHAIWMSEEWTGAVLHSKHFIDQPNQEAILDLFFEEASEQLIKLLTD